MAKNMVEFWSLFGVVNAVDFVNLILHAIGARVLYLLHLKNRDNTQTIYILNLATTEMILSLMNILYKITYALYISFPNQESVFNALVHHAMFLMSGTNYIFYFSAFFLTGDRLMQSLYPFRYRQVWSGGRAKKLIIVTWFICYLYSVLLILFFHLNYLTSLMFTSYICIALMTLDVAFVVFAVFTYTMMFRSLVISRRRSTDQNVTLFKTFVNSRFFTSALIIGSFILLTILSDFIYCCDQYLLAGINATTIGIYADVSIRLSIFVDALIYIYLQKPVREIFLERFCSCFLKTAPKNNIAHVTMSNGEISSEIVTAREDSTQRSTVNDIEMRIQSNPDNSKSHGT